MKTLQAEQVASLFRGTSMAQELAPLGLQCLGEAIYQICLGCHAQEKPAGNHPQERGLTISTITNKPSDFADASPCQAGGMHPGVRTL